MTTLTLASIIFCEIERTYIFFLFALLSLSLRFCSHIFPYKMQRSTICYCTCDVKACLPYPYLSSWSVGMSLRYTCCCCMLLVVRRLTFFFFPAAAILFSFFYLFCYSTESIFSIYCLTYMEYLHSNIVLQPDIYTRYDLNSSILIESRRYLQLAFPNVCNMDDSPIRKRYCNGKFECSLCTQQNSKRRGGVESEEGKRGNS